MPKDFILKDAKPEIPFKIPKRGIPNLPGLNSDWDTQVQNRSMQAKLS